MIQILGEWGGKVQQGNLRRNREVKRKKEGSRREEWSTPSNTKRSVVIRT